MFNHLLMQVANELYFYLVKMSSQPTKELYFTKYTLPVKKYLDNPTFLIENC